MSLDRTDAPAAHEYVTGHVLFELSKAKWLPGVILPDSQKMSRYTIAGGDLVALRARLTNAQAKAARSAARNFAASSRQTGAHPVVLRGRPPPTDGRKRLLGPPTES
jgi:hypothetical protein